MERLIPMTDFVLLKDAEWTDYQSIYKYANFLKQPLELWMFIPCDENGNVLEIPHYFEPTSEKEIGDYDELVYQYQIAKDRVLFNGFEIIKPSEGCFILLCTKKINCQFLLTPDYVFCDTYFRDEVIEDLIDYKLDLTPAAIKQIGL
jgi:hypothetical protein